MLANAVLAGLVGVIVLVALVVWLDKREARKRPSTSVLAWQEFVRWATQTPDYALPPVLVRVYDGSQYGAANYQQEAQVLATRGYRPTSTATGSSAGPGALDIAAIGVFAFAQGSQRSLTVTYVRQ